MYGDKVDTVKKDTSMVTRSPLQTRIGGPGTPISSPHTWKKSRSQIWRRPTWSPRWSPWCWPRWWRSPPAYPGQSWPPFRSRPRSSSSRPPPSRRCNARRGLINDKKFFFFYKGRKKSSLMTTNQSRVCHRGAQEPLLGRERNLIFWETKSQNVLAGKQALQSNVKTQISG